MQEDPILNAPIESLQLILRALSFLYPEIPRIIPDGVYGDSTREAVCAFQRLFGYPVTGEVDYETFLNIVTAYDAAMLLLSAPASPVVLFPANLVIQQNQSHPHVYLMQAMMSALSPIYSELPATALTGQIDAATANNLKIIQNAAGLPCSGNLDLRTYDILSRLYRANFDRELSQAHG